MIRAVSPTAVAFTPGRVVVVVVVVVLVFWLVSAARRGIDGGLATEARSMSPMGTTGAPAALAPLEARVVTTKLRPSSRLRVGLPTGIG